MKSSPFKKKSSGSTILIYHIKKKVLETTNFDIFYQKLLKSTLCSIKTCPASRSSTYKLVDG